jgi:tRNA-specific 2-thiouridylase
MSGGVDSSAAALILQGRGHRVVGVTMKLIGDGENDPTDASLTLSGRSCCSFRDIIDARSVSQKLNFDHQIHNFSALFRKEVIERFVMAYVRGRTPNPCVDCNRRLKFGPLFARAFLLGCEKLATGHYAKIAKDGATGRYLLKKARDQSKDQSYFLYGLSQEELARTLFPLGNFLKGEIRAMATESGIVNAKKPDSQDICFVRNGRYDLFLESFGIKDNPGDVITPQGKILGKHRGIHRYTIGQRRGLGIHSPRAMYVLRLDPDSNTVTVGDESGLYSDWAIADDLNVISGEPLTHPLEAMVKVRYRQTETPALLEPMAPGRIKISFQRPQKAVAPGQAAVFYQNDVVIGGGTIVSAGQAQGPPA